MNPKICFILRKKIWKYINQDMKDGDMKFMWFLDDDCKNPQGWLCDPDKDYRNYRSWGKLNLAGWFQQDLA